MLFFSFSLYLFMCVFVCRVCCILFSSSLSTVRKPHIGQTPPVKNPFFFFFQDGNPFGPFWDYVGVDFDKSVLFGGISFGAYHQLQWMKK